MNNYRFSGHETFTCKQFWLKKGFDFLQGNERRFNDESAVVELGVGKNMVSSIAYWLKSFGIVDDAFQPTEIGNYIFGEQGRDPYIEDIATVWLLHYFLVKTEYASVYSLFFNEFKRERIDFNRDHLHSFLKRKCFEVSDSLYNENTITSDVSTFLRNYIISSDLRKAKKIELDDEFSGLLYELNLISLYKLEIVGGKQIEMYKAENKNREELPYELVLFAILDRFPNEPSISFRELEVNANSVGMVFALTKEGLYAKLEEIVKHYDKQVVLSDTAGIQVLQFKQPINKWEVLDRYYGE
ncbi:DUF4007 family protein [Culturomica massiliensis]|uniref:DUF4007 family protein n=1 Tax=Culturomica massiliensis TaxID=1841857 RepID=UPI002670B7BD|nr:DUF4007 family protein [Culturomica massiliensis]